MNASCKNEASPTFLGDEAAARQVYGVRAQHMEGEVLQGLEDKAVLPERHVRAWMGCMSSVHTRGSRRRCKAYTGEVARATQRVQGWAGEAALRTGHIQGVHGVRQRWAHAVHGVRQYCVRGTYGWATLARIFSCYSVVHFRDKARLALGREGNGTERCQQRRPPC